MWECFFFCPWRERYQSVNCNSLGWDTGGETFSFHFVPFSVAVVYGVLPSALLMFGC